VSLPVRSKIGVSLPMLNQPYEQYAKFAALAEDAGFDSVWDYEFYRNPFITHALNARATCRIQLGTGIATAATRTPFEMANAAADVDEISGGRTVLGLSTGGAGWMEHFTGTDIDRPLTRLRESSISSASCGIISRPTSRSTSKARSIAPPAPR
jgi:alkanesulfonate monooxygenase SsuD/methylene tetrahydromethanopterin reductase-like flavin-dependent oxidoreductase (luciferase family)